MGSVPFVLEMDEVDQKDCPQKECFGRGGPVEGNRDTEVIGVGEGLLEQSTAFFGDHNPIENFAPTFQVQRKH